MGHHEDLERLIKNAAVDEHLGPISAFLDDLAPNVRIEVARGMTNDAQRSLWTLTVGQLVSLSDMVPDDYGPLEPVRHFGKNTLPAFRTFEKRFCRPTDAATTDMLWGYNEGPTRKLVGPGYFVCRATLNDPRGATVVDYFSVPPEKPAEWPTITSNERLPQRFVYGFMHDFLRRVSAHVTIGRAWRHHKPTANHFILCREG